MIKMKKALAILVVLGIILGGGVTINVAASSGGYVDLPTEQLPIPQP
jgi:hypothetical protein